MKPDPQQLEFIENPTVRKVPRSSGKTKKPKPLLGCDDCPLNYRLEYRVPGDGDVNSDIWFVGEGPGLKEAQSHHPFVGDSGDLLWEEARKFGITRDMVAVRNAVQCWPPGNRTPTSLEVKHCIGYLEEELRKYRPKVVITLGATALQALMGKKYKITECHGQELIREDGIKVVPIFHPSFLLCNGKDPDLMKVWRIGMLRGINAAKSAGRTSILESAGFKWTILKASRFAEYLRFVMPRWAAWDIETHGKDGEPFLISSAWGKNRGIVSDWDEVKHLLVEYMESSAKKVWQNGCGFDIPRIERDLGGIRMGGYDWDTFVAGVTIDSRRGRNNLTRLTEWAAPEIAGYDGELERYVKKNKVQDYADIPREIILPYSAGDAISTGIVKIKQEPLASRPLVEFYMELVRDVLYPMEKRGIRTDVKFLDTMIAHYTKENEKIIGRLKAMSGEPDFNPGSNEQMSWFLFDHLELPQTGVKLSPKTNLPSVDKNTMALLKGKHPAVALTTQLRSNDKSLKTYGIRIRKNLVNTDRFRVKYWIGGADKEDKDRGAETGRLSSPLQNIPRVNKDNPRAYEPADIFIPDPGYVFLVPDYSQAELRVAALLSQDEQMIEDFQNNIDAHTAVCWNYLGVPRGTKPNKETRVRAKVINFSKIFGASANGLARNLGCSVEEALKLLYNDMKKYPGYWAWRKAQIIRVWKKRYAMTLFGFKRPIEIPDERFYYDPLSLQHWQRQALNTPVQGTASQFLLLGMVIIKRLNLKSGEMLMNIHDSAPMQVKIGKEQKIGKIVKWALEVAIVDEVRKRFNKDISQVPWTVEISTGPRLSKLQEIAV